VDFARDVTRIFDTINIRNTPYLETGCFGLATAACSLPMPKPAMSIYRVLAVRFSSITWRFSPRSAQARELPSLYGDMAALANWAAEHASPLKVIGASANPITTPGQTLSKSSALRSPR